MRLYAYRCESGNVMFFDKKKKGNANSFIGYGDFSLVQEPKIVSKKITGDSMSISPHTAFTLSCSGIVPINAENIRIAYDIVE